MRSAIFFQWCVYVCVRVNVSVCVESKGLRIGIDTSGPARLFSILLNWFPLFQKYREQVRMKAHCTPKALSPFLSFFLSFMLSLFSICLFWVSFLPFFLFFLNFPVFASVSLSNDFCPSWLIENYSELFSLYLPTAAC